MTDGEPQPEASPEPPPLTIVEQTDFDDLLDQPWPTPAMPTPVATPTMQAPAVMVDRFRITPLLVISVLAAALGIAGALVDVVSYQVRGDSPLDIALRLDDLNSSHLVAAVIAGVAMVIGAVLGASGRSWGSGLAGGAGLALAGLLGNGAGLAVAQLDAAEVVHLAVPGTTITITYDTGFFLLLAGGGLAALAFVLSLFDARDDVSPKAPIWLGLIGALGALAVAGGTLVPLDGATFADNVTFSDLPPITVYLRLTVLLFVVVGGVLGFLTRRSWGMGLALGAICAGAWQWLAALADIGNLPLGIAGGYTQRPVLWLSGNFFATDAQPYWLTTVGVVVMLVMALFGIPFTRARRG